MYGPREGNDTAKEKGEPKRIAFLMMEECRDAALLLRLMILLYFCYTGIIVGDISAKTRVLLKAGEVFA